jgi:hypothetical protein
MRHAAWFLAYHGCDREVGEAILSGQKELRPSENDYDWLGRGAYFWENSFSRAMEWAESLASSRGRGRSRIKQPFVVGAIIDPGECLDLSEAGHLDILKTAYGEFVQVIEASGVPMPRNEPAHPEDQDLVKRKLDCAVVNFLHQVREERKEIAFDTVRCPFMEGGALFDGSKIYSRTHVQWCVRDPARSIFAYFRPRPPRAA